MPIPPPSDRLPHASIPEKLLHLIWLHQDFHHHNLLTTSNSHLQILHPGSYNTSGPGPDFLSASISLNNQTLSGHIELHSSHNHWLSHNHNSSPRFQNTILHVSLFPPPKNFSSSIPTLSLLPYLSHSIEDYLEHYSLLSSYLHLKSSSSPSSPSTTPPNPHSHNFLLSNAHARWTKKLAYASLRLQHFSFPDALHQSTLETLGFPHNKVPMHNLAYAFPLSSLLSHPQTPDSLFQSQHPLWSLKNSRPANHPRIRLSQYLTLLLKNPSCPTDLLALLPSLPQIPDNSPLPSPSLRKQFAIPSLQKKFLSMVLHNAFPHSTSNTLIVDSFLPLLAAYSQLNLFPLWFHWPSGNIPASLINLLPPHIPKPPPSNGLNQALLHLLHSHQQLPHSPPTLTPS